MRRSESTPSKQPINKQSKIDARRQTRPAHRFGVEGRTLRFGEIIEAVLSKELPSQRALPDSE